MINPNLTYIAYVLDRSGSMGVLKASAIEGFNQFLQQQSAFEGETRFTLVEFDYLYETIARNVPIREMVPLNNDNYRTGGNTALDDAIGATIDMVNMDIERLFAKGVPGKIIVAIFTDGEENASVHFSTAEISRLIEDQQKNHGWQFLFLSASHNAREQALARNFRQDDTMCIRASLQGVRSGMNWMNSTMASLRSQN